MSIACVQSLSSPVVLCSLCVRLGSGLMAKSSTCCVDTHVVQPPQGLSVLISSEAGYLWQLLRDGINAIDSKAEQQGRHVITSDMVKYMALWCVCVCARARNIINIHAHTQIHTYMHIYMCVCVCIYIYMHTHTLYICIYMLTSLKHFWMKNVYI